MWHHFDFHPACLASPPSRQTLPRTGHT
jgi:hypothetical protein